LIENLLGNSWKFTRKHAAPRIEFGKGQARGKTAFFVRDNGAGFEMKYAKKLFGAFERLHSPGEYEGHGIGLATVQRIVHRHGGQAWGEGRPGEGAIFYFTLSNGNGSSAQL
jgi:light-regulated signal transduction histidine kinase (bacteriophytochrome)